MSDLISPEYAALNAELHKRRDYGARGHQWAAIVREIANRAGSKDVLDYGAGKGTLAKALPDLDVHSYDPAVPEFAADPQPADVVVCVDVMEHFEPDTVRPNLARIASLTRRYALLSVSCRPAGKHLSDGRNAHLALHDPLWWAREVGQFFDIIRTHTDQGSAAFSMICRPKAKPRERRRDKPAPGVVPLEWSQVAAIQAQCQAAGDFPSQALNASAFAAMQGGEYELAVSFLRRALDIDPENEHALNNIATCYKHLGRDREALAAYDRVLEQRPDFLMPHNNVSRLYLRKGDFRRGWHYYRWRLKSARPLEHMPRDALKGRMLDDIPDPTFEDVRRRGLFLPAEQGLGDELFFLRWVPEVIRRCRPPVVWYHPTAKLRPLVERAGWPLQVAPEDAWLVPNDTPALPLGCLPRWLGHERAEDIPPALPLRAREWWWRWLLRPPVSRPATARRWIGVTWRSGVAGSRHRGGLFKEVPPAVLGAALRGVDAEFLVLQRGVQPDEFRAFSEAVAPARVHAYKTEAIAPEHELEYLLRVLADLDDYIAVSNTNVYLRLALGLGGKTLLGHPYEWRWGDAGESPFFPGWRTYRQEIRRGWGPAMQALAADLG